MKKLGVTEETEAGAAARKEGWETRAACFSNSSTYTRELFWPGGSWAQNPQKVAFRPPASNHSDGGMWCQW